MRDDFTQQTLDILAKRVGIRCSNPDCRKLTTGPRSELAQVINIGVGAHITAASPGGPRFDLNLSSEERKSPNNGIWLCQNCAKLVDNDPDRYSIEILRRWKGFAESSALAEIEGGDISKQQTQENQIDLNISYKTFRREKERHDYVLKLTVHNFSNEIISTYHIDVEFPARVIEKPKATAFLLANRSNDKTCFFHSIRYGEDDTIYPGKIKEVMSFPYYMDDYIYSNCHWVFKQVVKATFYREGFKPLTIEKPFRELHCF
jgi:hypothetical protein